MGLWYPIDVSRIIPCTDVAVVGQDEPLRSPRDMLVHLGPDAVERVSQLLWNQANPNVALKAAEMILDRVVPKETKHTEDRHIRVTLEKGEEREARKVLLEADIIDVEPL